MKRYNQQQPAQASVDINMSPLVDCVFLLLIFFVVTSSFVRDIGVDIDRPTAVNAEELDTNSIQLAIDADGNIFFNSAPVALSRLPVLVARQQRLSPKAPVIIIADKALVTGKLVEVIDLCKEAGASRVSVATRL